MTLTKEQVALIQVAVATLDKDEAYAHPLATIRRIAGDDAAEGVKEREAEYRAYNNDVAGNTAQLSPDAAEYWSDFQAMIRYGKRHFAIGDRLETGKKLSAMCERLEESFDARVPDIEKARFQVYDPQRMDEGNHDDRWQYCRDWFPPVLRGEFLGDARIANPRGRAQREVLAGLLTKVTDEEPAPVKPLSGDLRALVRRLDQ